MTNTAPRSWRGRLASAALLVVGVIALIAMGPQFIVFVPVLIAAWCLARFGLVPRAIHGHEGAVRITGGPEVGGMRFAEARIQARSRERRASAELALALVQALSRQCASNPSVDEHPDLSLDAFMTAPERLVGAPGFVLDWNPETAASAGVGASKAAGHWGATWPRLIAAQQARRAAMALEARWDDASGESLIVGMLGEPQALGAALAQFARECRASHDLAAWTTGWPRDVERHLARGEALRRRRERAR